MNPVKRICEITGLRMADVARKCGYTHQQVQIWHSGKRDILFKNVLKICDIMEINPIELFNDSDRSEHNTDLA